MKIVSRRLDCTREVNLLRKCQGHPNIVTLQESMVDEVKTGSPDTPSIELCLFDI